MTDEAKKPDAAIKAPGVGYPVDASGCLIGGSLRVSGYVVGTPYNPNVGTTPGGFWTQGPLNPTPAQLAAQQSVGEAYSNSVFPGYEAAARFRVMGRPGCGRCYGSGAVPPMGEPCSCVGSGSNANQQEERAMIEARDAKIEALQAIVKWSGKPGSPPLVTILEAEWQAMRDRADMALRKALNWAKDLSATRQELISAHATIDRLTTANAELGARVEALEDERREGWGDKDGRFDKVDRERRMWKGRADILHVQANLQSEVFTRLDMSGGLEPVFDIVDGEAVQTEASKAYLERWIADRKAKTAAGHLTTANMTVIMREVSAHPNDVQSGAPASSADDDGVALASMAHPSPPTAAPIPARTLAADDSAHGLRMPKGFW